VIKIAHVTEKRGIKWGEKKMLALKIKGFLEDELRRMKKVWGFFLSIGIVQRQPTLDGQSKNFTYTDNEFVD